MSWSPSYFLTSGPAHPVPVSMLLLGTFGPAYLEWEPETLWRELEVEYKAFVPNYNKDCIQAVRAVHLSDAFTSNPVTFEKVVIGLNCIPVFFNIMQKPTVGQVLTALEALKALRRFVLAEEVERYVAAVVANDATYPVPAQIAFCKKYIRTGPPNPDNLNPELEYARARHDMMTRQNRDVLKWLDERIKGQGTLLPVPAVSA